MEIDEFIAQWHSASTAVVVHTSGSTGAPKAIRLPKSDMEASARATLEFFGITAEARFHCPLAANYIAAKMMVIRAILASGTLTFECPSSVPILFDDEDAINARCFLHSPSVNPSSLDIDLLCLVPMQVPALLKRPHLASRIKNTIIGGAPINSDLEKALAESPFSSWATYGMTETSSHVALRPIGEKDQIYTALPGISFDTDSQSRLIINTSTRSWSSLTTTDIVELIDAQHFRWLGRADNIINSGGIKINPEQIESLLQPHIPYPIYIGSQPDDTLGQALTLHIEATDLDTERIMQLCKQILPPHHAPRHIFCHAQFSRTASGKIIRR